MKEKIILCLLGMTLFLTGCGAKETEVIRTTNEVMMGMEPEAVIDYVVPESIEGILINQAGYDTKSKKTAIFRGEELPEIFYVYDAETKQEIYGGNVEEKGYDEVTGERIGYGSFDVVVTPGEYYIEADILGYSYNFSIGSEVYKDLLKYTLQYYYEEIQEESKPDEEEIKNCCKTFVNLLLAYELHGQAFTDSIGIEESGNGIPDLLDTMLVQAELLKEQQETVLASEDDELISYYVTAMVKFSYTYKEYDNVFATECLQAAEAAWTYMEQSGRTVDEAMRFMAAAELYRASGSQKYHTIIKEYGAAEELRPESREAVYGAVTYLSTKQSVDIDLCGAFMEVLRERAAEIATESRNSYYQINLNKEDEELLWDMVVFTVIDKVISNHEYAAIIENHLHYFVGRNPFAASMIDGIGEHSYMEEEEMESVMDGGFRQSVLLLMLSEINDET